MGALEKIKQSLRWRSAFAYYDWQRWWKTKQIPEVAWREPDPKMPRLVSCVYAADVPLLLRCLESLHRHNIHPPHALLVGDSLDAVAALKKFFPTGAGAVEICFWQDLLRTLPPLAQQFCESWLAGGPFGGYAKKFAVTLAVNASEPIVMCDADVLFGGDFFAEFKKLMASTRGIIAGEDYRASYDREAVKLLKEPRILEDRALNCGLVYYPAGSLAAVLTPALLETALPLTRLADNHLEQTLVAYTFWKSGGAFFPRHMLETTLEDNLKWRKGLNSMARHYAGGKHLFWRDV